MTLNPATRSNAGSGPRCEKTIASGQMEKSPAPTVRSLSSLPAMPGTK